MQHSLLLNQNAFQDIPPRLPFVLCVEIFRKEDTLLQGTEIVLNLIGPCNNEAGTKCGFNPGQFPKSSFAEFCRVAMKAVECVVSNYYGKCIRGITQEGIPKNIKVKECKALLDYIESQAERGSGSQGGGGPGSQGGGRSPSSGASSVVMIYPLAFIAVLIVLNKS
ncbi:hypothetical protein Ddc_14379 [Ditylenchus destructor]|nr:hypothetical protein Ddc_14379 [Ditylenchus destructor]